jgi:hypothetical protein
VLEYNQRFYTKLATLSKKFVGEQYRGRAVELVYLEPGVMAVLAVALPVRNAAHLLPRPCIQQIDYSQQAKHCLITLCILHDVAGDTGDG